MEDGAWRIDATTPMICCTASGDKPLARDKLWRWVGLMTMILLQRLLAGEGEVIHHRP